MKYSAKMNSIKEKPEIRQKELTYMSQYMALILQKEKLQELKMTG